MSGPGQRLCTVGSLQDPSARGIRVGVGDWPLRVVVVRAGGAIHAFVNRCPHAGHPLDLIPDRFMSADGSALICSSHGALFRPDTGVCTAGPCVGQELRSVPITVADGWVCLTRDFRLDDYDL